MDLTKLTSDELIQRLAATYRLQDEVVLESKRLREELLRRTRAAKAGKLRSVQSENP